MSTEVERNLPNCMVAHHLANTLSDIIGHCDLLNEMTEPGTESARRLAMVRGLAESAVTELTEHQRRMAEDIAKAR